jgi:hypothetical protein
MDMAKWKRGVDARIVSVSACEMLAFMIGVVLLRRVHRLWKTNLAVVLGLEEVEAKGDLGQTF